MANATYTSTKEGLLDGLIDLKDTAVGVLLVGTGYTYSAAHQYVSDVSAQELAHASYSRKTLTGKSVTGGVFDADDVSWTAINAGTAKAAILYQDGASDAARRLICYIDTVGSGSAFPITFNGGDWNLAWDNGTNKILKLG